MAKPHSSARKVLILTYYWPPSGGAGVQRWLKFVKYLRDFDFEPVVYTAAGGEMPVEDTSLLKEVPPGITVLKRKIWEPYSVYKLFIGRKKDEKINASFLSENKKSGLAEKLSVWIRGNFFIPDARRFWIGPSIRFLSDYLRKNPVDLVISSGPPHSMHLIAAGLKKKFSHLKWLADFRDPWTQIDFYHKLMLSPWADALHHRLEMKVLREADLVLSIGHTMNEQLQALYRGKNSQAPDKFRVITNGYDAGDLVQAKAQKDARFSLAHVGTLVKDRNPEVLWKVLSELVKNDEAFAKALEIKLVGKVDYFVNERLKAWGLSAYVRRIEYLPHDEVILEQQRSAVLLLLINQTPNARSILTGKFFEYMASGTPILAIGPEDGDAAAVLAETRSGLISGFMDEKKLRENLLLLFRGKELSPDHQAIARYERRELTRRLSLLLEELITPRQQ